MNVFALAAAVMVTSVVASIRHIERIERYESTLSVCHALREAVREYHHRYGVYPVGILAWKATASRKSAGLLSSGVPGSHLLVDAWGNYFRVAVDGNCNNELANPIVPSDTKSLGETILVYSAGPDGDYETWADNISPW